MTVTPALAPGRRPFTVGKHDIFTHTSHVHVSSGHLYEPLLMETAGQHRITLREVLQPCGGCLETKGVPVGANIARKEAYEDCAHRPDRPLRGIHGRDPLHDRFLTTALRGGCGRTGVRPSARPPRMARRSSSTQTPSGNHSSFARKSVGSSPTVASSSSATLLGSDVSARTRVGSSRTQLLRARFGGP